MQTGLLAVRPPSSNNMAMLAQPRCPPESSTADLLSQCTTDWSRYFIASRITPKYTDALAADIGTSARAPARPVSRAPAVIPAAALSISSSSVSSASSSSSSSDSDDSDSATMRVSQTLDHGSGGHQLHKVASCAVTADEKKAALRRRRRVQFADEVGQELTRVKLLTAEPCVKTTYMNGVSELASVIAEIRLQQQQQQQQQQHESSASTSPATEYGMRLQCKFSQPSEKYIVFRESVERNLLSLSLVHLDFTTIRGIVAVKNISYRKRVFARVTFDAWHSYLDVEAAYSSSEGHQDNFAFSVQCPADQVSDIEFCLCYESELGVHWDSNNGENYRIAVSRPAAAAAAADTGSGYTKDFKPYFGGVTDFAEFSAWQHTPRAVYY